jgi:hypothetical protein
LIILGKGSTYIVDSTIINSFHALKDHSPELANALATIAGYIESSKTEGAKDAYDNLAEAITKNEKPSKIRAFWNDLVRVVPEIASLTIAAKSITELFS